MVPISLRTFKIVIYRNVTVVGVYACARVDEVEVSVGSRVLERLEFLNSGNELPDLAFRFSGARLGLLL